MSEWLDALTLHRPWPWAIIHLGKRTENRDWPPPKWLLGKHLAIHAGKTWDEEGAEWIASEFNAVVPPESEHPTGVVAVAKVVSVTRSAERLDGRDPWWVGDFGWTLDEVRELRTPVALSGRQKLWRISGVHLTSVRSEWGAGRVVVAP